jgi:hypothetical protein
MKPCLNGTQKKPACYPLSGSRGEVKVTVPVYLPAFLAVKTLRPEMKIVAVEAENVASFSAALEAGKPTGIAMQPTLADGLAIPQVGSNAFQIAKPFVVLAVTVSEERIALAILRLVELEKSVVEGQAATSCSRKLSEPATTDKLEARLAFRSLLPCKRVQKRSTSIHSRVVTSGRTKMNCAKCCARSVSKISMR